MNTLNFVFARRVWRCRGVRVYTLSAVIAGSETEWVDVVNLTTFINRMVEAGARRESRASPRLSTMQGAAMAMPDDDGNDQRTWE